MQDDMEQKEIEHDTAVRKLNNDIGEKLEQIEKLTAELTDSQERNHQLEEKKRDVVK